MQIDLTNTLAVAVVILGFIGTLINIIRNSDLKRISSLEKDVEELKKMNGTLNTEIRANKLEIESNTSQLNNTEKRIDGAIEKQFVSIDKRINDTAEETETLSDKVTEGLDKLKEAMADVRETVAGFGSTYVPRKELHNEGKARNSNYSHQQEE